MHRLVALVRAKIGNISENDRPLALAIVALSKAARSLEDALSCAAATAR